MKPVDVHSASILIVDDLKADVELLERILMDDGYTDIHTKKDSEKVLELHNKNRYDLILLDLEFPGMDGFKVMKALKTNGLNTYFSIIVLTAHPDHKLRALKAGARDFIGKPYNKIELLSRIHNVLELGLVYKKLEKTIEELEFRVQERTSELQVSEARYRGFTDLVSDWYWEQDTTGSFTKVSGPVPEILGIEVDSIEKSTNTLLGTGWNTQEQSILRAKITARESFLDFEYTRSKPDGDKQTFLVSGQPMFDKGCNFLGYRGIGVEISSVKKH